MFGLESYIRGLAGFKRHAMQPVSLSLERISWKVYPPAGITAVEATPIHAAPRDVQRCQTLEHLLPIGASSAKRRQSQRSIIRPELLSHLQKSRTGADLQ